MRSLLALAIIPFAARAAILEQREEPEKPKELPKLGEGIRHSWEALKPSKAVDFNGPGRDRGTDRPNYPRPGGERPGSWSAHEPPKAQSNPPAPPPAAPAPTSAPAAPAQPVPEQPPATQPLAPVIPPVIPSSAPVPISIPVPAPIPIPAAAPAPSPAPSSPPTAQRMPSSKDLIPNQCQPSGPRGGKWVPFLQAHQKDAICPINEGANIRWNIDAEGVGCCPQNAYLSTAAPRQWACCPCGINCDGLPPVPFQDWTMAGEKLLINGVPYTVPQNKPVPTGPPGRGGPGILTAGQGIFTTQDPNNGNIILGFVPTSSKATCVAGMCSTVFLGPNGNLATYFSPAGPPGGGIMTQTTATAVLYGTFAGTTCVSKMGTVSCGATQSVYPTATSFGVITMDNGAGPARARATGVVGAMVVGGAVGLVAGLL